MTIGNNLISSVHIVVHNLKKMCKGQGYLVPKMNQIVHIQFFFPFSPIYCCQLQLLKLLPLPSAHTYVALGLQTAIISVLSNTVTICEIHLPTRIILPLIEGTASLHNSYRLAYLYLPNADGAVILVRSIWKAHGTSVSLVSFCIAYFCHPLHWHVVYMFDVRGASRSNPGLHTGSQPTHRSLPRCVAK